MTQEKNAEQVGLVAVRLNAASTAARDQLIDSLRAGGFTDLEWENDVVVARRPPEVGPHDAILEAALASLGEVPTWCDDQDVLSVLSAPEVERAAGERLGKPLPAGQAHFLLELALRHGWADAIASAERIACDASVLPAVRSMAVHVALDRAGADAHPTLIALTEAIPVDEPDDDLAGLRASILSHRLRWGLLRPLDAAVLAAVPRPRYYDSRGVLLDQIAEAMDLTLGREVIDQLRRATPPTIRAADALGVAASRRVLSHERLEPDDIERLVFIVTVRDRFAASLFDDVQARIDRDRDARRALYRALDLRGGRHVFLKEEDAAWLVERLKELPSFPETIAGDLFLATKHLLGQGDALGEDGKRLLQERDLWNAMEERFQRPAPWVEEHREAQRTRREKRVREMLPLEDVIERLLTDKRGPSTQVHLLGDFVWGDRLNGRNVEGSFDDLSDEVQARILETAARALTTATPSRLPEGREYSSHLIEEGVVFQHAALADDAWLTPDQVKRWLGAALATWTSSTKRMGDLIERCFAKAPLQTIDALMVELERRAKDGYAPLDVVPTRMRWHGGFQEAVAGFVRRAVRGPERSADAAMDALAYLLDADEGGVPPAARALVAELVADTDMDLRWRALGVWFAHRPNDALPRVLAEATDEASVRAIFAPAAERRDLRRTGGTWGLDVVGPSAVLLATHVPRTDHDQPHGAVSPHHKLCELRDHFVGRVFHAAVRDPDRVAKYRDAICELPRYGSWASYSAARETLQITLERLRHPRPTPGQVAELLRGKIAVVHDARDLAEWVVAVLSKQRDQTDAVLLYGDRPKGAKRHPLRRETLVQAMLRKELETGLQALELPADVRVWREPLEHGSKEPDFVVSLGKIEVPIEVKWSTNDLLEGLHDQLGRRYVGEHQARSHGVYFVAWCGQSELGKTPEEIQACLVEEAKELREERQVVAHIVVADLRHPSAR